jgi:Zn-dependent peptidase ImmA (M78 family)
LGLDRFVLRDAPTLEDAFLVMKQSMESLGIAVMISGHVSFHHAIMPARLYRSFSVIDPMLPVISINENLPLADWLFTVIHEMAHLLIGESGVEGLELNDPDEKRIEMLCDDVAAEFLLPLADLQRLNIATLAQSLQLERITEAASALKVSPQLLAFRLFKAGLLSETVWRELFESMDVLWRQNFKVNREYVHEKLHAITEYDIRCLRIGPVLLSLTQHALVTRAISATEAGKVLGIQARKVAALLAHAYEARTS